MSSNPSRSLMPALTSSALGLALLALLWFTISGEFAPVRAGLLPQPLQSPLNLHITKTVSPAGPLTVGDPITYIIAFANDGPDVASNVLITDTVPLTLTDISYTSSGAHLTALIGPPYTWQVEPLSAGAGGIITVTGTLNPSVNTHYFIANWVTITDTHAIDTSPSDNTASAVSEVNMRLTSRPHLISPPNNTITSTHEITFTWSDESANGAVAYDILLDGTVSSTTVPSFTTILPDDVYTWTVRALDWKGGTTGYTDTWTLIIDSTPPEILATQPYSGEVDVPLTMNVVITFSKPIDSDSFAYTISPDPGGWAASWNGAVVTLQHHPFAPGTVHTFTVTAADDLAGNSLVGAPVAWPFTTIDYGFDLYVSKSVIPATGILGRGAPLTYVIAYANAGPETATDVEIVDAVPISLTNVHATSSGAAITPTGAFSYTWIVEPLEAGDGGVITITGNLDPPADVQYSEMTNYITATSTTEPDVYPPNNSASATTALDSLPPQILATRPISGEINVPIWASVMVTFSEPIDSATFAYAVLPDPGDWTVQWDASNSVVTLSHGNHFPYITLHTATVSAAADLAGNPLLGAPVEWPFTTQPPCVYLPLLYSRATYFLPFMIMQNASP